MNNVDLKASLHVPTTKDGTKRPVKSIFATAMNMAGVTSAVISSLTHGFECAGEGYCSKALNRWRPGKNPKNH